MLGCVALTSTSTWISLAGSLGLVMPSGGSVSFVYGFIFCIICNICLSASVGELASIYPTAGGQYHYAYALSGKKWKNLMVRDRHAYTKSWRSTTKRRPVFYFLPKSIV